MFGLVLVFFWFFCLCLCVLILFACVRVCCMCVCVCVSVSYFSVCVYMLVVHVWSHHRDICRLWPYNWFPTSVSGMTTDPKKIKFSSLLLLKVAFRPGWDVKKRSPSGRSKKQGAASLTLTFKSSWRCQFISNAFLQWFLPKNPKKGLPLYSPLVSTGVGPGQFEKQIKCA